MAKINIARDFSKEPAGRYPSDGPDNGQRFRLEKLVPTLESAQKVVIEFDGTEGYGSSFLEEAFGGLIRHHGYSAAGLHSRLDLISEVDESIPLEVWEYIDTAKEKEEH